MRGGKKKKVFNIFAKSFQFFLLYTRVLSSVAAVVVAIGVVVVAVAVVVVAIDVVVSAAAMIVGIVVVMWPQSL